MLKRKPWGAETSGCHLLRASLPPKPKDLRPVCFPGELKNAGLVSERTEIRLLQSDELQKEGRKVRILEASKQNRITKKDGSKGRSQGVESRLAV